LERGTLISFDTVWKISGEEPVKALESEERRIAGAEREGCKIHEQYCHSDFSAPLTEPHGICQSQRINYVAGMK